MFARRGYNVQSLAVGNSEVEGQSRITMVIPGAADGTSKIIKQLNKLVHVQQVIALLHPCGLLPQWLQSPVRVCSHQCLQVTAAQQVACERPSEACVCLAPCR